MTMNTKDTNHKQPFLIEWQETNEDRKNPLIGRTARFIPGKQIGYLSGIITNVTEKAYTIRVVSCEKRAGNGEIGKIWQCQKETIMLMLV